MNCIVLNVIICINFIFAQTSYYECGYHAFDKIYDGDYTAIEEFPWMARLEYFDTYNKSAGYDCAGSLITDQHVLTAAHCVKGKDPYRVGSVRLGEYDTSQKKDCVSMLGYDDCADDPVDVGVQWIMSHSYFNGIYHDIAIIKLNRRVAITDFVRPICLPNSPHLPSETNVYVSGWGQTEQGTPSRTKLKVALPIVSFFKCYNKFLSHKKADILEKEYHICAGGEKGKDACKGDSGGPLMSSNGPNGRWEIIGITSSGKKCGTEGWPGIYTKVYSYLDWIKSYVRL